MIEEQGVIIEDDEVSVPPPAPKTPKPQNPKFMKLERLIYILIFCFVIM
jgi:hypothetical protein